MQHSPQQVWHCSFMFGSWFPWLWLWWYFDKYCLGSSSDCTAKSPPKISVEGAGPASLLSSCSSTFSFSRCEWVIRCYKVL
jgi:hypothetical protein